MDNTKNTIDAVEINRVSRLSSEGELVEGIIYSIGNRAKSVLIVDGSYIKHQALMNADSALKWAKQQISHRTIKEAETSSIEQISHNTELAERAVNSKYSAELERIEAQLKANEYLSLTVNKANADKPLIARKQEIMAQIAKQDNSAFNALAKMVA